MSGFFSSFGRNSASSSSKSSLKSIESNKEKIPQTSDIYTTPLEGIKPTKKYDYDDEQLKKVSSTCHPICVSDKADILRLRH